MKNPRTSSSKSPYISQSNYLPPEVWTQILSTLPAKTLIKFRCVCKTWCSIIDNPDFIRIHFQHSEINSENNASNKLLVAIEGLQYSGDKGCVLTVRDAENLCEIDHIFSTHSYRYRLIGSSNGLLLVGRSCYTRDLEQLRLWNPCIRKSLTLPPCPLPPSWLERSWYLFGFAPDSQDYKVVAFGFDDSQGKENGLMYFAVYTLSNQQWTLRNDPLNVSILNNNISMFYSLSTAVFFRGAAYWLGNNDHQRIAFTHLGSFDFDQEKLSFLELPFTCEERGSMRFLFFLQGSLAVFSISLVSSSIWVLELGNKKGPWILWFSGQISIGGYKLFQLCYYECRKLFYCESDGGYLVCRNMAYNIASCLVQSFKSSTSSYLRLETYSESLVLFKGDGARDLRFFP